MSKERLKRLAALEARLLKPKFKPFNDAAAVDFLKWCLECSDAVKVGKACHLPRDPLPPESEWSPAMRAAMRQLDRLHERLQGKPVDVAAPDAVRSTESKPQKRRRRRSQAPAGGELARN
jgi:hypothetical protein